MREGEAKMAREGAKQWRTVKTIRCLEEVDDEEHDHDLIDLRL